MIRVDLQGLGQAAALNNPLLNITMFAPLNSAFTAPLPAVSTLQTGSALQVPTCSAFLTRLCIGYVPVTFAVCTQQRSPTGLSQ